MSIDPDDDQNQHTVGSNTTLARPADTTAYEARLVQIFRSTREEGLYLYVDKKEGVARVPDVLLSRLGKLESALLLMLAPDRKLARADAGNVLKAIDSQGFYLQLPPEQDKELLMIRLNNQKLQ